MDTSLYAELQYQHKFSNDYTTGDKSLKDLYLIGLYAGYYLKSVIHDKKILKSLRGGENVYFLARDMTIIWDYFKDQYPNAKIVYGVNRKAATNNSEEFMRSVITSQVDVNKKGLIIDTGFTGSMVRRVTNYSAFYMGGKNDGKPLLRGLLLSGERGSYFPFLLDDGPRNAKQYRRGGRNGRNIIVDLEHSPKLERYSTGEQSTYVDLDKVKEYRAFRLGFFAGLQGLNKGLISGYFRKLVTQEKRRKQNQAKREAILDRIQAARLINLHIKDKLKEVEELATLEYRMFWEVDRYGEIKRVMGHKDTPLGVHFDISVWSKLEYAEKYQKLVNEKKVRKANYGNPKGVHSGLWAMEKKANQQIRAYAMLEGYEKRLNQLKEEVKKGNFSVPSHIIPLLEGKPYGY